MDRPVAWIYVVALNAGTEALATRPAGASPEPAGGRCRPTRGRCRDHGGAPRRDRPAAAAAAGRDRPALPRRPERRGRGRSDGHRPKGRSRRRCTRHCRTSGSTSERRTNEQRSVTARDGAILTTSREMGEPIPPGSRRFVGKSAWPGGERHWKTHGGAKAHAAGAADRAGGEVPQRHAALRRARPHRRGRLANGDRAPGRLDRGEGGAARLDHFYDARPGDDHDDEARRRGSRGRTRHHDDAGTACERERSGSRRARTTATTRAAVAPFLGVPPAPVIAPPSTPVTSPPHTTATTRPTTPTTQPTSTTTRPRPGDEIEDPTAP